MPARVRFLGWIFFCVATIVGAAPLQPGSSRAELIVALGEPSGAITTGSREVLTYPEGKVTLENNRVVSTTFDLDLAATRDRPVPENTEASTALPANVRKAQGTISVIQGKELAWFRDIEEAKEQAQLQNKSMLVLFTSEPAMPWNPVFNRTVVYNSTLLQELQQEFVLLKLNCPSPTAVDSGDADATKAKRLNEFRSRTIGGSTFPALAIVTPDGRRAAEVNLDEAGDSQGRMAAYVKEAISAAKEQPLRARGGVSGTWLLVGFCAILVLIWLLKH